MEWPGRLVVITEVIIDAGNVTVVKLPESVTGSFVTMLVTLARGKVVVKVVVYPD